MPFYRIDNAIQVKKFLTLSEEVSLEMGYGHSSNNSADQSLLFGTTDPHRILFYEAASILKLKFQKVIKKDLILVKLRVNGTSGGQEADWHTDTTVKGVWTAVLYTSATWDPMNGGSTIIYNPEQKDYISSVYLPNRAIMFPAYWEHGITTSSVRKNGFRTSLAAMFSEPQAIDDLKEVFPSCKEFMRKW